MERELAERVKKKQGSEILVERRSESMAVDQNEKNVATCSKYATAKRKISLFASQKQVSRIAEFTPSMTQTWVDS